MNNSALLILSMIVLMVSFGLVIDSQIFREKRDKAYWLGFIPALLVIIAVAFTTGYSMNKLTESNKHIQIMESAFENVTDWEVVDDTLYLYDTQGNYYSFK